MIALVGTNGQTRVLWGIGETLGVARANALMCLYKIAWPTDMRAVEVSDDDAEQIMNHVWTVWSDAKVQSLWERGWDVAENSA